MQHPTETNREAVRIHLGNSYELRDRTQVGIVCLSGSPSSAGSRFRRAFGRAVLSNDTDTLTFPYWRSHNGVTDFVAYFVSVSCGCECRLGKVHVERKQKTYAFKVLVQEPLIPLYPFLKSPLMETE